MADYDDLFVWRSPFPIGDPIGPWVQVALHDELISASRAAELTVTQVGLQKEAIALQRQALDLQERAVDAIAESVARGS
jgi:hypothetical protein